MKMTLNTKEMKEILKRAKRIMPKKGIKPILGWMKITNSEMLVTDLETWAVYEPDIIESEGQGTYLVEIEPLKKIVDKIKAREFIMEFVPHNVIVRYKNISVSLPTGEVADYPEMPGNNNQAKEITIGVKKLKKLLDDTMFTASTDEMMRNLNGILFEFSENNIKLVSADSYRMSVSQTRITNNEDIKVFYSLKSIKELYQGLKYTKQDTITFKIFSGKINNFKNYTTVYIQEKTNYNIILGHMDISFPNYQAVIPEQFQTVARLKRNQAIESFEAAGQILGEKDTLRISLNGGIKAINRSETFTAELDGQYVGKEMMVAFDDRYLLEGLKHFEGEEITFSFVDENNALKITEPENPNYLQIVMPVKIRD
jgi:DNA polymerase-3 subunit beta